MKKARRQMQERLSTALAELRQVKPIDFSREDLLSRDLSFRVGLPYFERTLDLFHRLSHCDLGQASLADLANLTDGAARTLDQFHKILSFTGEDAENPRAARDLLIEDICDSFARISTDFERVFIQPRGWKQHPSTSIALSIGLCTLVLALAAVAYYSTHERTVANGILNAVHRVRLLQS
jgi:hypothetical protein